MKINIYYVVTIFIFLFSVSGCDTTIEVNNRSGSINNDYIEEPLSKRSLQYKSALDTSNTILELIKAGKLTEINTNFVAEKSKLQLTEKNLNKVFSEAYKNIGKIKKYKKMQWGFLTKKVEGQNYLYSVKIVEHEKASMNYFFTFDRNSDYKKLVGLSINIRKGVRSAGSF